MSEVLRPSTPLSVVIPAYNGARFIEHALRSVFGQTTPPSEIIVVDDHSSDDTAELVEKTAASAPIPVHLIKLAKNSGGPARPMNVGIKAARGEFIAVLDQDDVFVPTRVEDHLAAFRTRPDLALVFGYCARGNALDQIMQPPAIVQALLDVSEQSQGLRVMSGQDCLRLLMQHYCFLHGYAAFTFRRSHWVQKGGIDEWFRTSSDYELVCWLSLQGAVGFVPTTHYIRNEHEVNLSKDRARLFVEASRIRARYLQLAPWILASHPDLSAQLRDEMRGLAYWFRQAGRYRDAFYLHRLTANIWGWDTRTMTDVAKLLPHRVYSLLACQQPTPSKWTCDKRRPNGETAAASVQHTRSR